VLPTAARFNHLAMKRRTPLIFFSQHSPSIWIAICGLFGGPWAWLRGRPHQDTPPDAVRLDTSAAIWADEPGQRTAFRTMLMTEIAGMRLVIKEYEIDTGILRQRLNAALAQSLVLRATVEIMEKRVAFLKDRQATHDHLAPTATQKNATPT
jgi:hypothetical protein